MPEDDLFLETAYLPRFKQLASLTKAEWEKVYKAYISSTKWKNIRKTMFRLRGRRCEVCGFGSSKLEVHHLNYERFGNERESDLQVLCKAHHEEADRKREAERRAEYEARKEEWEWDREQRAFSTWYEKKTGQSSYWATEYDWEDFHEWVKGKEEERDYY